MIVVDASALIAALLDDGRLGEDARGALREGVPWAAPPHLLLEVVSVIRRKAFGGVLNTNRAAEAITSLSELPIQYVTPGSLIGRVWGLRDNVTVYDAAYVAAAELLDCPLVTLDGRLARASCPRCEIQLIA